MVNDGTHDIILEMDMSEEIHSYVLRAEEIDSTLDGSKAENMPENA